MNRDFCPPELRFLSKLREALELLMLKTNDKSMNDLFFYQSFGKYEECFGPKFEDVISVTIDKFENILESLRDLKVDTEIISTLEIRFSRYRKFIVLDEHFSNLFKSIDKISYRRSGSLFKKYNFNEGKQHNLGGLIEKADRIFDLDHYPRSVYGEKIIETVRMVSHINYLTGSEEKGNWFSAYMLFRASRLALFVECIPFFIWACKHMEKIRTDDPFVNAVKHLLHARSESLLKGKVKERRYFPATLAVGYMLSNKKSAFAIPSDFLHAFLQAAAIELNNARKQPQDKLPEEVLNIKSVDGIEKLMISDVDRDLKNIYGRVQLRITSALGSVDKAIDPHLNSGKIDEALE